MTAADELCRMLAKMGVEYVLDEEYGKKYPPEQRVTWSCVIAGEDMTVTARDYCIGRDEGGEWEYCLDLEFHEVFTPEQAIAATLGRVPWVNPTWERWHKSLKHDEIKSVGDAVEQLMYEAIEFGGDMGPNGNTYNGIDEGDVLTSGFINGWISRFESTLGRDKYSYKQWREISNAVGDAMEYAYNKAIECPDNWADPLWNLDEYVNRILKAAFEGEATLGDTDATPTRQGDADLAAENTKLRELVRDYHRFADAMCAERDCDGCSQRDEGACERGVLTSRECVLGVAE